MLGLRPTARGSTDARLGTAIGNPIRGGMTFSPPQRKGATGTKIPRDQGAP